MEIFRHYTAENCFVLIFLNNKSCLAQIMYWFWAQSVHQLLCTRNEVQVHKNNILNSTLWYIIKLRFSWSSFSPLMSYFLQSSSLIYVRHIWHSILHLPAISQNGIWPFLNSFKESNSGWETNTSKACKVIIKHHLIFNDLDKISSILKKLPLKLILTCYSMLSSQNDIQILRRTAMDWMNWGWTLYTFLSP